MKLKKFASCSINNLKKFEDICKKDKYIIFYVPHIRSYVLFNTFIITPFGSYGKNVYKGITDYGSSFNVYINNDCAYSNNTINVTRYSSCYYFKQEILNKKDKKYLENIKKEIFELSKKHSYLKKILR